MDMHLERLDPMIVAAVVARGSTPEPEAWEQITAYAEPRGYLEDPAAHPWFGFNNPPPEPGRDEYGYEMWIRVEEGADPAPGVDIKHVPGGTYAVTRCRLVDDPRGRIDEVWLQLVEEVQRRGLVRRHAHELERVVDASVKIDDLELDLMLPVEA